jgi:predicted P-loop ATPase
VSHDSETLAAIRSLRQAGFALHHLHPRAKRPIGDDWSTKPVATAEQLLATHRPGNNLGVRLGEQSVLASGEFLHGFDIDIRIAELADEAWSALRKLLPGVDLDSLPSVASGSGGESRHLYFCADRAFRSKKVATSDGKHRGADGKWHYDWEVEFFGSGKQVALPPSIHPATGKPYRWERPFDLDLLALGVGPTISSAALDKLGAVEDTTFAYESREPLEFKPGQLERDLDAIEVSDLDYDDWIRLGQALHHQFGGSQEGFDLWLAHTKRSKKFTGENQIREMRRSKWRSFGKYRGPPVTMGTIRLWAQEARTADLIDQFDDVEDEPEGGALDDGFDDIIGENQPVSGGALDDDDIEAALSGAMADAADGRAKLEWVSLLDITEEGGYKATLHNLELILKNDPRLAGLAQLNEFTQETVQRTPPGRKGQRKNAQKDTRQLSGRVWDVEDTLNGELWSDDRDFSIRSVIEAPKTQGGYGMKVSDRDLKAGIVLAANEHAFHPVREYLEGLVWDGIERVETLWVRYVKANDDSYHRSVARLALTAAVTRIFEPGHKFDYATILEGLQGKRKSTLIEILGRRWFAELDGDFHDQKQMVELMQGAWIMEIPELTGFGRADVRAIKAFISRKNDRARLAYARRAGEFPRQVIFIGSTNDREYLKDDTGGRRFWPVACNLDADEEIDTDSLDREADQLWAEAVVIYRQMRTEKRRGTLPLYLQDAEARQIAARLQESRRQETPADAMAGQIAEWLSKPKNSGNMDEDTDADGQPVYRDVTCSQQVWVECLNGDAKAFKYQEQQLVNTALAKVPGWEPAGQHRFSRYGKQRSFRPSDRLGPMDRLAQP